MNLLPRRRSKRPRGHARLAPVPGRDTQPDQLRTGPADGTTWTLPGGGPSAVIFEGASEIGVMPAGVVAIKDWGRDTQPLAFRIRTETRPGA